MEMNKDTICAISTPMGSGGIGIIRLTGEKSGYIIGEIFAPKRKAEKKLSSRVVKYGHIIDSSDRFRIIDEVLVTFMKAPGTYTREDMAEIGCHGGLIPMKEVLNLCVKYGARLALPGEFTKRAFINGRIDLTQAESVLEVINSKTEKALHISQNKLKGGLKDALDDIRKRLFAVLSDIEAKINFPEEEDIKICNESIKDSVNQILHLAENLLKRAGKGKIAYGGVNSAIIGRANVGKSSLLNALLREERAIVTEVAGTTRDSIREIINIRGIPVNIIDTAGIRKVRGRVERMGLQQSLKWMEKAEINLLVLDGTKKLNEYDRRLLQQVKKKKHLLIINKTDMPLKIELACLEKAFNKSKIAAISAKTGEGLDELEEKIYRLINEGYGKMEGDEIFLNMRQESQIKYIYEQLGMIKGGQYVKYNIELVAEQLKTCIKNIDELTGKDINEEVLTRIFSQFCIGK